MAQNMMSVAYIKVCLMHTLSSTHSLICIYTDQIAGTESLKESVAAQKSLVFLFSIPSVDPAVSLFRLQV